eukprot:sb/3479217/
MVPTTWHLGTGKPRGDKSQPRLRKTLPSHAATASTWFARAAREPCWYRDPYGHHVTLNTIFRHYVTHNTILGHHVTLNTILGHHVTHTTPYFGIT